MSKAFARLSVFVLVLSVTALACGGQPQSEGGSSAAPESTATPTPAPTPIRVSASTLQNEQELNEVVWKSKYVGNTALITGTITSVTEAGNKYDVKLETDNFTVDVVCKVDKSSQAAVLPLQQGQTVSVLGRVTDDGILDIVVKDCNIASSGGTTQSTSQDQIPTSTLPTTGPPPTVTATQAPASRPTNAAAATVPAPSATPAPTAPPTPTMPPTPNPPGMTLGNPVAAGEVLQGSDGTEIVATSILDDATDLVMATNSFNDSPESGNRFYMVTVAVAYVSGSDSLNVAESDYSLIGDNRVVYTPFENPCGVIPNELAAELFPGGQAEGNVCFQIESGDSNFVLIHEPFYSFGSERRFLRLDPQRAGSKANLTVAPPPTSDSTSMDLPPGMTLGNPVAAGEVLQGSDGTEIVATSILDDATDLVMATNSFNDSPESGNRFYMVTVAVAYVSGSDSLNVAESDYSLIGDNRVVYTPFENPCGVIPNELAAELFPGGQAEGNICFQIESDDSNFVLIHEPFLSFDGERRFLSLE